MRSARGRRIVEITVIIVALVAASSAVLARSAPAAAKAVCVVRTADDVSAVRAARACGRRVEAMSGRTPTTQVFANPDGTWTSEQSLDPRFARDATGTWVTADPTLRVQPDGTLAPVAAVFAMTFSGGGTGPLVTMRKGAATLSLTWPTALPKPSVTGDTALYPEILPGVDLQVVAAVDGFSHVLVVKSAAAAANPALAALDFKLTTVGLSVAQNADGTTVARDPKGAELFASPTPLMWDSNPNSDAAHVAPMATSLKATSLRLTPAATMLTDPTTVYPVFSAFIAAKPMAAMCGACCGQA